MILEQIHIYNFFDELPPGGSSGTRKLKKPKTKSKRTTKQLKKDASKKAKKRVKKTRPTSKRI